MLASSESALQKYFFSKYSQSFFVPHCLTGKLQASSSGQYEGEDLLLGAAGSAAPEWCCQKQSATGQQPGRFSVPEGLAIQ